MEMTFMRWCKDGTIEMYKRSQIMTFNELPVNSIFLWEDGVRFLKLKDAEVGIGMSKQMPNCFNLENHHYCTMTSRHRCVLLKQPKRELI